MTTKVEPRNLLRYQDTSERFDTCGFANRVCNGVYECGLSNGGCDYKFSYGYRKYCRQMLARELHLDADVKLDENMRPVRDGSFGREQWDSN